MLDPQPACVHTVRGTGGHGNEAVEAATLLHRQEHDVFADGGYQGAGSMSAREMGLRGRHGRRIGGIAGAFGLKQASQTFDFESLGAQARFRKFCAKPPIGEKA